MICTTLAPNAPWPYPQIKFVSPSSDEGWVAKPARPNSTAAQRAINHNKMLDLLQVRGWTAEDLSKAIHLSPSATYRRLEGLVSEGKVERTRGAATMFSYLPATYKWKELETETA